MSDYYGRAEAAFPLFAEPAPSSRKALGFYSASDADLKTLTEQKRQILVLLQDRWMTGRQLIAAIDAGEATRRVRELRAEGFEILKEGAGRAVQYHWTGRRRDACGGSPEGE